MEAISNTPDCHMDYLLKSQLFAGFTMEEIEAFLNSNPHEFVKINPYEELTVDKDKSIFVLSGALATYELTKRGTKNFISYFSPEDNPIIPICKDYSYPNMAIFAKKKSVVLLLANASYTDLETSLLLLQNKIQRNVIDLLYKGTALVVERNLCNTEPQAREKILKYISGELKSGGQDSLELIITKHELADHLQMDTSTLMRELKKLKNEGVIAYDRKIITIKNEDYFNDAASDG